MEIRIGNWADLEDITNIFNVYIESSYARFEVLPFTLDNRQRWFSQFSKDSKYQIYVASDQGSFVGFACSQPYRAIPAFDDTVEVSIYLAENAKNRGVGSALYSKLFLSLSEQRIHRALSGIALPNDASVALHRRFGFREVGVFSDYAKKNGQYISSMWLEKAFDFNG